MWQGESNYYTVHLKLSPMDCFSAHLAVQIISQWKRHFVKIDNTALLEGKLKKIYKQILNNRTTSIADSV